MLDHVIIYPVIFDRKFLRPNAADLSDYGCFIVLSLGVASLQMIGWFLFFFLNVWITYNNPPTNDSCLCQILA